MPSLKLAGFRTPEGHGPNGYLIERMDLSMANCSVRDRAFS